MNRCMESSQAKTVLFNYTSQLYYSRKICVYNLTIYESRLPNDGYCNVWTEMNGKRGSSEIGSALWFWLKQIPKTVKELSLFSDCCGGQNRNQHIAAFFYVYGANTPFRLH